MNKKRRKLFAIFHFSGKNKQQTGNKAVADVL
jgi:hypothetical protein